MTNPLRILFVASEVAGLVKTGGLADVAFALPRELHRMGHDVRVAMPCYGTLAYASLGTHTHIVRGDLGFKDVTGGMRTSQLPGAETPLYLIEHEGYYNRPHPYHNHNVEYTDNIERFAFFCLAVLDGIKQTGWKPDVVQCNDWHTSLMPVHLRARYAQDPFWGGMPTVMSIHNLAYQGRYPGWRMPETGLGRDYYHPGALEYYGDLNMLKGGILYASQVSTVSPRYAKEIQTPEYGEGLDGVLRGRAQDLSGILNGVDYTEWCAATDKHIAANFTKEDLSGKAVCKQALQARFGLPQRADVPLFGMVTRLTWQKGLDLLHDALEIMLQQDIQFVLLGSGDPFFEHMYSEKQRYFPDRVRTHIGYDLEMAHQIQAGCDFFLMPSHFEPSGLSQLYSLAYAALPVVRRTGGLADSISDASLANLRRGTATGIVFGPKTGQALAHAMERAVRLFEDPKRLHEVRLQALSQDFSWEKAGKQYLHLYRKAIAAPGGMTYAHV